MREIILTLKIFGTPKSGVLGSNLFCLLVNPPLQQVHNRLLEKANENIANKRKH